MAHLESFRANTVDAASAYVAISRAREHAAVYTDSRAGLTYALGLRDGARVGAIDEIMVHERQLVAIDLSSTSVLAIAHPNRASPFLPISHAEVGDI